MTKIEMFNLIASVNADNAEIVEFCNKEIGLLESRKNRAKTPTKTQKANEVIKDTILDILSEMEMPVGLAVLMADPRIPSEASPQKLSALLGQLVKSGEVVRGKDKKKVVYSLADGSAQDATEQDA